MIDRATYIDVYGKAKKAAWKYRAALHPCSDADDVAQELFVRILSNYDGRIPLTVYINIQKNRVCVDMARRYRHRSYPVSFVGLDAVLLTQDSEEEDVLCREALDKTAENDRERLILRERYCGTSNKEIGAMLGLTEGRISQLWKQIKERQ